MKRYTSSPSDNRETGDWYVWDFYQPLPPEPVFIGDMLDASSIADFLNAREDKAFFGALPLAPANGGGND